MFRSHWVPAFAGTTSPLLHRIDDLPLVGLERGLDLLFDRARPLQERRLALADRHADRGALLRAALAVVLFRQHPKLGQLAAHPDPRPPIDRYHAPALATHS